MIPLNLIFRLLVVVVIGGLRVRGLPLVHLALHLGLPCLRRAGALPGLRHLLCALDRRLLATAPLLQSPLLEVFALLTKQLLLIRQALRLLAPRRQGLGACDECIQPCFVTPDEACNRTTSDAIRRNLILPCFVAPGQQLGALRQPALIQHRTHQRLGMLLNQGAAPPLPTPIARLDRRMASLGTRPGKHEALSLDTAHAAAAAALLLFRRRRRRSGVFAVIADRLEERGHLMKGTISHNQAQSGAIRRSQTQSDRLEERGHLMKGAISHNQTPSDAIRRHPTPFDAATLVSQTSSIRCSSAAARATRYSCLSQRFVCAFWT